MASSYAPSRAKSMAERAVELDDGLSEAHDSLALYHLLYSWDWERSTVEFLKAIDLNPQNAKAHVWLGLQFAVQGRFEEALEQGATAERLGLGWWQSATTWCTKDRVSSDPD